MTSSVISSCGLEIAPSRASAKNGFSVPKASECRTTETRASGGSAPQVSLITATTSPRLPSSAALTLKNSARRPIDAISATIRSALACVALRSRWTPKTFQPALARASEQASPKPEEAPRTRAQRGWFSEDKAPRILTDPPSPDAGEREGSPLASLQRRPRPKVASREASGRRVGVRASHSATNLIHYTAGSVTPGQRWILLAALLLLLVPVWVEPSGSWLADPDEGGYAAL